MKHAPLALIAVLLATPALFATPALAQDDIHALMGQLDNAQQERSALRDEHNSLTQAHKALDGQLDNLKLDQAQYDKAFAAHQARVDQFNEKNKAYDLAAAHQTELVNDETAKLNVHQQWASQHNANQCHYPEGNPGVCAAYSAEAAQIDQDAAQIRAESASINASSEALNQEAASINAEAERINADKAQVDQQGQNLNAAIADYRANVAEYQAKADRHNQALAENEAKFARILADLKAIGKQTDDCTNALKDTRDGALENIHAVCGRMFDGNR